MRRTLRGGLDARQPRRAPGAVALSLLCCALLVGGCGSTAAPPDPDEARRVALEALRKEASRGAGSGAALDELVVVRMTEGRTRAGEPAAVVVFGRPPASEIGCVWVSERDGGYDYEIDRCPRSFDDARPPGPDPTVAPRRFDEGFATCSSASREEIAAAYGVPGAAPKKVIARAVSGEAAGLLDLSRQAYRGCLAGMRYRERFAGQFAQLSGRHVP